MERINGLKVATRLGLAFGMLLLLTGALGIFSVWQLSRVNQTSTEMEVNWLPSTKLAGDMNTTTSDFRAAELQHVLSVDDAEMTKYEKEMVDLKSHLDTAIAAYGKLVSTPEEQKVFDGFKSSWSEYLGEHDKVLALSRANKNDEAKVLVRGKAQHEFNEASADLVKLSDINEAGGVAASKRGDELFADARSAVVGMILVAAAFGVLLAFLISRSLLRQLGGEPAAATAIAGRIAAGDLTTDVAIRDGDKTSMMFAIKQMRDNLAQIVGEVRAGTDTIATASSQIASGNVDLSSRTEEQASALEETASSMEELTSTVRQSADNARQANSLAMSASEVASKGGAVVFQVVETMGSINESSKKISDIIGVIDGIAFQTNILALNAAVEAARAGEQGRGFAVVASEVRNLAQRSAAAAKEIKTLIGDSVDKVDTGSRLVDQAGATMSEIVESVRRVTDIMGEIMSAAQEQTAGIEQINEAVSQMDQVTQQNAALVEEAAAASQSMQHEAANLAKVVSIFKLGSVEGTRPAVPATARKPLPAPQAHSAPSRKLVVTPTAKRPQKEAVAAASASDWEEF